MQVSSPTSSNVTTPASSSLVDQIKRHAAILADDSGASNEEKVDAYLSISKAVAQSASSGSGWFQQSTQADRDAVSAVMDNSSMAKQVRQAADDFNARGMRSSRAGNVMADQLNYLDGQSDLQQKMIFAGTASLDQTRSLESWKGFLQQQSDGRDQQLSAEASEKSAVKVTLSDKAKAALNQSQVADAAGNGDDPGAAAIASLIKPDQGDGIASAALQMLQKAAEDRAEAKEEKAKDQTPASTRAYETGDHVDTSI